MSLARSLRRGACAALSLVVLVSSLTCMTVACRIACDADPGAPGLSPKALAELPPCHRAAAAAAAAGHHQAAPGPEGCGSRVVCCSTWLHDDTSLHLADPRLVRAATPGDDAGLVPLPLVAGDPDLPYSIDVGAGPPHRDLAPLLASRSTRAPPAAIAAA